MIKEYHNEFTTDTEINPGTRVDIYTDGAYSKTTVPERAGYGFAVYVSGLLAFTGRGSVPHEESWQVTGELSAVIFALKWARDRQINHVDLHYDLEGIKYWATGEWKRKKSLTQRYHATMKGLFRDLTITWNHVRGHTGNPGNERADALATSYRESA